MRLGFVCNWDRRPEQTWSHIPWSLRSALAGQCDLRDLGVVLPLWQRQALKYGHARWRGGRWTSQWKWSPALTSLITRTVERRAAQEEVDAVVQVHGLARLSRPYVVFQDLSLDVVLREVDRGRARYLGFDNMGLDRAAVERRRAHQLEVYDGAAGLLAMSRWLAQDLVERTGVPADRVHVVHPGTNAAVGRGATTDRTGRRRSRLLFVGRDFHRKGGPEVVAALGVLRREISPDVTLTICGPPRWPLPGPPPEGVEFLGEVPAGELAQLYADHDLFVMPSHFEAFGIVFVEALANGLPCIARDACAMPEIIESGVDGILIDGDDPDTLAAAIDKVLQDDSMYQAVSARAAGRAAYFSWDRAASQIVRLVS